MADKNDERAFQEEKSNLQSILKVVRDRKNTMNAVVKEANEIISDPYITGYDGAEEKQIAHRNRKRSQDELEVLKKIEQSPYFGRMEVFAKTVENSGTSGKSSRTGSAGLSRQSDGAGTPGLSDSSDSGEQKIIYIGNDDLAIRGNVYIYDWKAPISSLYYNNERNLTYNNHSYDLLLKRNIEIKNSQLLSIKTAYDANDEFFQNDIVDEFLIDVLMDKRRTKNLTDIIRTIQGNQNEIIRKDFDTSFIVQGCAGSGKTMILLHRLSVLIYNSTYIASNLDRIKILTPNQRFNMHINNLSKTLGLDKIERIPVEEYYARLLEGYTSDLKISGKILPDSGIDEVFLRYAYSSRILFDLDKAYGKYWISLDQKLEQAHFYELISKASVTVFDPGPMNIERRNRLVSAFNTIEEHYETARRKLSSGKDEAEKAEYIILQRQKKLEEIKPKLQEQKVLAARWLQEGIELVDQRIQILHRSPAQIEQAQERIAQLELGIQKLEKKKSELEIAEAWWNTNPVRYIQQISGRSEIKNAKTSAALHMLDQEFQFEQSLMDQQNKIPAYLFEKKNALAVQLQHSQKVRASLAARVLKELGEEEIQTSASVQRMIDLLRKEQEDLNIAYRLDQMKKTLTRAAELLLQDPDIYPDLGREFPDDFSLIEPFAIQYIAIFQEYAQASAELNDILGAKNEQEQQARTSAEYRYCQLYQEWHSKIKGIISSITIKGLRYAVYDSVIKQKAAELEIPVPERNTRFSLHLLLYLCSLYYPGTPSRDMFINIDEAQDLSAAEYTVLKKVLPEKTVFNLYGDVNQQVYSYKGISKWKDIRFLTEEIYYLNENYRNTYQITTWCNSYFQTRFTPIGLNGAKVRQDTLNASLKWLKNKKEKNPDLRCAVIYKTMNEQLSDELRHVLEIEEARFLQPIEEETGIYILTAEEAKGLEFDAVSAVVDGMSRNEKYVSFARALDNLSIVFPDDD